MKWQNFKCCAASPGTMQAMPPNYGLGRMSPRQRIELAGWRGLCFLMTAVDTVLAVYFTFTPTTLSDVAVWNGILGVTGTLQPVGWLFALVAAAAIVGLAVTAPEPTGVLRFAFLAALVPWGSWSAPRLRRMDAGRTRNHDRRTLRGRARPAPRVRRALPHGQYISRR